MTPTATRVPCPACESRRGNKVKNSRPRGDVVRRRRECISCSYAWTTVEVPVSHFLMAKEIINLVQGIKALTPDLKILLDDFNTSDAV